MKRGDSPGRQARRSSFLGASDAVGFARTGSPPRDRALRALRGDPGDPVRTKPRSTPKFFLREHGVSRTDAGDGQNSNQLLPMSPDKSVTYVSGCATSRTDAIVVRIATEAINALVIASRAAPFLRT